MKKFFVKTLIKYSLGKLEEINARSIETMAKLDDVKAAVAKISEAAAAEKLEIQAKLDAVSAQISDLAAQIESGASGDQLDEIVTSLNAAAGDVSNIFTPDAQAPVDEVPAEDPVEAPVDEVPAETPAEEVPAETPVDEVPAELPLDPGAQPILP